MNFNANNQNNGGKLNPDENASNGRKVRTHSGSNDIVLIFMSLVVILVLFCGAKLSYNKYTASVKYNKEYLHSESKTSNILNVYDMEWIFIGIITAAILIMICVYMYTHRYSRVNKTIENIMSFLPIACIVLFAINAIVLGSSGSSDFVSGGGLKVYEGKSFNTTFWFWLIQFMLASICVFVRNMISEREAKS